jgi:translation initiation factor 2 beta subunit (eIF-2beta)/eIF-5
MINIHGKTDPNYRYTMHRLETMCKRNNKTYFTNLPVVAAELKRDPLEILKWFGYTLGVQVNLKEYALNGKYETPLLQTRLQEYINNHIMCGVCGNPETTYLLAGSSKSSTTASDGKKSSGLIKKCGSCGGVSNVKLHPKMAKLFEK